ncbi:MAG: hypothetical protein HQM16_04875 [Deltaproteobacteria bacterium]|nr:hypothetical protein [Deltaproteobacteria bacterium]
MPRIPVSDLKEGMKLQDDVLDKKGRLILKKSTDILQKHIKIFKTWGVSMVTVADEKTVLTSADQTEDFLVDEAVVEEIKSELDHIFCHNDKRHAMIGQLYNTCLQRAIIKKSKGES